MKTILISILLAGCGNTPEYHCKAGYAFAYSYASGYRQILGADGGGVPCAMVEAQ